MDTFDNEVTELYDLYVDGEVISTTGEHPFWVPGQGWVKAKDLAVGSLLQTDKETFVDVDKIERREGNFKVYNFEVEGFPTYFVSELGILVHNTCNPPKQINLGNYGVEVGPSYPKGQGVVQGVHNANVRLIRDGKTVNAWREISGEQTPQQIDLNYPSNTLSSHTEQKAITRINLEPGDVLRITGQKSPCPTCKGGMNKAAKNSGATIEYKWRENGKTQRWDTNKSRRR